MCSRTVSKTGKALCFVVEVAGHPEWNSLEPSLRLALHSASARQISRNTNPEPQAPRPEVTEPESHETLTVSLACQNAELAYFKRLAAQQTEALRQAQDELERERSNKYLMRGKWRRKRVARLTSRMRLLFGVGIIIQVRLRVS